MPIRQSLLAPSHGEVATACILLLSLFVASSSPVATIAATPTAGPENGGLRLRLSVEPLGSMKDEGFDVRLELINALRRKVEVHADWQPGETGSARDYLIAATQFECFPPLPPVKGATSGAIDEAVDPQPKLVLAAGEVLALHWQTRGMRLKNMAPTTGIGDETTFPLPGLYAVHATIDVITVEGTFRLRSNEQLVPVGGSDAAPRHTYGPVTRVVPAQSRAEINLGSLHGVEVGDRFESLTKQANWRMTIVDVSPRWSEAKLELVSSGEGVDGPPERPTFATLVIEVEEPK